MSIQKRIVLLSQPWKGRAKKGHIASHLSRDRRRATGTKGVKMVKAVAALGRAVRQVFGRSGPSSWFKGTSKLRYEKPKVPARRRLPGKAAFFFLLPDLHGPQEISYFLQTEKSRGGTFLFCHRFGRSKSFRLKFPSSLAAKRSTGNHKTFGGAQPLVIGAFFSKLEGPSR